MEILGPNSGYKAPGGVKTKEGLVKGEACTLCGLPFALTDLVDVGGAYVCMDCLPDIIDRLRRQKDD